MQDQGSLDEPLTFDDEGEGDELIPDDLREKARRLQEMASGG